MKAAQWETGTASVASGANGFSEGWSSSLGVSTAVRVMGTGPVGLQACSSNSGTLSSQALSWIHNCELLLACLSELGYLGLQNTIDWVG